MGSSSRKKKRVPISSKKLETDFHDGIARHESDYNNILMVFVCNNGNRKNHSNRSTIYNQCLTNSGTSSYGQTLVNGSPGINDQLIRNGNAGFDNPVICNEDAAMYSQAMHNDDIDLDEYTL